MDKRRWIAFILFSLGVVILFNAHFAKQQQELMEARRAQQEAAAQAERATSTTLPTAAEAPSAAAETPEKTAPTLRASTAAEEKVSAVPTVSRETAPTVVVDTDRYHVVFSTLGGVPIEWDLLHMGTATATSPEGEESSTSTISLIPAAMSSQREYPLTIEQRPLDVFNDVPFTVQKNALPGGGTELVMTSEKRGGGLQVVRRYQFSKDGYLVPFSLTVLNGTDLRKPFGDSEVGLGVGWQGGFMPPEEDSRVAGYLTGLIANKGGLHTEHVKAKSEPTTIQGPVLWAGVERKFFMTALIPGKKTKVKSGLITVRQRDITPEYNEKGIAPPVSVVLQQDRFELEPGKSATFHYTIFAGPKNYDILKKVDGAMGLTDKTGLSATLFRYFSIIRWLSLILLGLLQWIHDLTGSYGFAIILLTVMVRLVTYPLTHKSMKIQAKTMAQQAKLKPFIDEINKKYKDDPAKKNQAMMKLWKEHGVNPFGMLRGCVPVMLQMPIFIALYVLLDQAIELRGQSFYWISDLSMPDRLLTFPGFHLPLIGVINSLNILPVLMGVTQVVSSRMTMSAASDATQRQMMLFMPLIFVFLLYNFPSGLMLYWVVTNLWQIGQQKLTNRIIQREQSAAAAPARG